MDPMVGRIYEEEYYTLLHTKNKSCGPCGFREEDFPYVCPIVRLWELMTPRVGPFLTPGASSLEALDLVFSKKIFNVISHYKPKAGACMDPRGTIGMIYKEEYSTLLYTKYESSVSCSFREEDFLCFPIVRLWVLMTPGVEPFLTPGHGMIYVELMSLLHTKYRSFRSCGFRDDFFLCNSHYKPMADNDAGLV